MSDRTSRTVGPSPSTTGWPPACARIIVGIFTFTVIGESRLHWGRGLAGGQAAEQLVVDQLGHRGFLPAYGAVGIPAELHRGELHVHGVEQQQPADERFALADDQLDRLHGLN